jgi:hypothetical protein
MVNEAMAQPKCDLMKIATETIARRYPSFDPTGLQPVISEKGQLWELTYALPAGTLGGTPVVTIDKGTCAVVSVRHEQ